MDKNLLSEIEMYKLEYFDNIRANVFDTSILLLYNTRIYFLVLQITYN